MKDLVPLKELFSNKIFRVPDYQRGYSWEKKQLEEFWDDICSLAKGQSHYTGLITLNKLDEAELSNEKWNNETSLIDERKDSSPLSLYYVVDGQQRLTTFTILIKELLTFLESKGITSFNNEPLDNIKDKYFSTKSNSGITTVYRFGYDTDNPSHNYFTKKILENEVVSDTSLYTHNLDFAQKTFKKNIQLLYAENGNNISVLETLFENIVDGLKFNVYHIENNNFNSFVAFETMNNRGKELSKLELLKNRLIYLTTLFTNHSDKEKNSVRQTINNTWKNIYKYLGQIPAPYNKDDDFLKAHWTIYFEYSRNEGQAFSNFLLGRHFTQKRIIGNIFTSIEEDQTVFLTPDNDKKEDNNSTPTEGKLELIHILNYVNSLNELIPHWCELHNTTNPTTDINLYLQKLNFLGFAYFKPLICVALSKKNISDDKKVEFLKAVERWIFILFKFTNVYTQQYQNTNFYKDAHSLYLNTITIDEIIEKLNNIPVLENDVIDTTAVLARFTPLFNKYKGFYDWGSIRYFLYEYELWLKKEFGSSNSRTLDINIIFTKDPKDKYSIEHIYPQTDTVDYWEERFGNFTEKSKHYLHHTLGNLLPLSAKTNSKFKNDPYPEKRLGSAKRNVAYQNGCHSEVSVATKYDDWTYETIEERGLEMLQFVEERWGFTFEKDEAGSNFVTKLEILHLDKVEEKDPSEIKTRQKEIPEQLKAIFPKRADDNYITLFEEMNNYILRLTDGITTSVAKSARYVGYFLKKSFLNIRLQSGKFRLHFPTKHYKDPENKLKKLPDSYGWSDLVYLEVESLEDFEYAKSIIKQSIDNL